MIFSFAASESNLFSESNQPNVGSRLREFIIHG
jgi:hypothetical protein